MKSIKLAALIAIIAETVLDVAYWLFGSYSVASEHGANFLGIMTAMFHLPGERLIDYLLHSMASSVPGWLWIGFIIFTGAVQFFVLVLLILLAVKLRTNSKSI
ncbi:MAG: hypothetical protein P4N60_16310 [Verrucomicrobiae bacterium]|nr:hypothetical protein [Verrucomicrobiae bacterium]